MPESDNDSDRSAPMSVEIDPTPPASSADPDQELVDLVRAVCMTTLEPNDQILAFHGGALNYYDKLVKHVLHRDTKVVQAILDLCIHLRGTYNTYDQYKRLVDTLPVTRARNQECSNQGSDAICEICPVCHDDLDGWKHVVRLRALTGDPATCAHTMHRSCATKLRAQPNGMLVCPVCRAELGASLAFWLDLENKIPHY